MTFDEFERWLLFQIGLYHDTPHEGLGGVVPRKSGNGKQQAMRRCSRHGSRSAISPASSCPPAN